MNPYYTFPTQKNLLNKLMESPYTTSKIAMSYNVPRVPEVRLLLSYSLRFWEHAVLRRIVPRDSDSAMDGAALSITRNDSKAQNKN